MSFLLDTDICSAFLKGNRNVWGKVMQYGGQLHVSTITIGELSTWGYRQGASPKRGEAIRDFCTAVIIIDVDSTIGDRFGKIRARLLDQGQGTPDMDLLIAATALVSDLTLVTHNTSDYDKLVGLKLADWVRG